MSKPDETYQVHCVVQTYPKPVGNLEPIDWSRRKKDFPHLADLPIEPMIEGEPVTLLLGTRNPQLFEILDVRRGKPGEPWVFLSPLGWVVVGPVSPEEKNTTMLNVGHLFVGHESPTQSQETFDPKREYLGLSRQVERLWNHEREAEAAKLRNMSSPPPKTLAQLGAEALFKNTVRLVEGVYEVGLIWKTGKGPALVPNNYQEAKRIFLAQEKKMDRLSKNLKSNNHEN